MQKTLYKVIITQVGYVLADSKDQAAKHSFEIASDGECSSVGVEKVRYPDTAPPDIDKDYIVYQSGEYKGTTKLNTVWPQY